MLVNLNDVLKKAQREHYAVGLFNATDSDMLDALISAAEELRSPIIIGTAEVLLPYGELSLIAPGLVSAAQNASVPVVVHYDHGLTFGRCMEALKRGFTSVMFDGSAKSYDENIAETKEIVRIAHAIGASVEGEIGHVGDNGDEDDGADMYTKPAEAVEYLSATGVDALAVAIGTAHGAYKHKPKLDIGRLRQIRAALDVPLVLHGGSGLSDDDFRNCIEAGVCKVNIFTDLCLAGSAAMRSASERGLDYLQCRNEKVEAIKKEAEKKMALFGCAGKA
ncbi:MAG: class II fructose-bisphosphate aldolase [Clostridia bacterium]|nr:class II fructose-bisphosphate aldolase [Clostridia bacterium]